MCLASPVGELVTAVGCAAKEDEDERKTLLMWERTTRC